MAKKLWIIGGGVVLVVAVYLVVRALTPAERFIYGVAPLGPDEALLLTRRNEDDSTSFWVELVGADGTHRWSAELTPFDASESLGFTAVAAVDDRIVLLGQDGDDTVVRAITRAAGVPLWTTVVTKGESNMIGPTFIVDGPRLYVLHDAPRDAERREETITTLALGDGALLWTLPPLEGERGRRLSVALVAPGRLLVSGDQGRTYELDGATGDERAAREMTFLVCTTPRWIVGNHQGALVLQPTSAGASDAPPVVHGQALRLSPSGPCGERGDDIVQGLHDGDAAIGLTRIDPVSGAVRWRVSLGPWIFDEGTSADGRLPRFLPVSVFGSQTTDGPILKEVVVIDLDQGIVTARERVDEHVSPFYTAERAFVMMPFSRRLVALDPVTGGFASVTQLTGTGADDVRAEDFRHGRLWATGMGWAGPDALPWAVFDLARAAPLHLHGEVMASDATARSWAALRRSATD